MQPLYPNCAGLDVHKAFVAVCRLTTAPDGQAQSESRKFSTMTADLQRLAAWLAEGGCTHVVMESSGVFWRPIYNILETRFVVLLANPQRLPKRPPGRKTDRQDAIWLAELLQYGLVQPSYIPEQAQRDLRDLVRYRQTLVEERNRVVNRLQQVLEDANIKLSAVVSDMQGVSAQAILQALLHGQEDPQLLAELARGRMRSKRAALEAALTGHLRAHHRFLLQRVLAHLEDLDEEIALLEKAIAEAVAQQPSWQQAVARLDEIPGVNWLTAVAIVAEIGVDMSRFASDRHLASWAGLAPGSNETGGRPRAAPVRKGNKHLQRVLVQAAHAASQTKHSYLRALYYRLVARRGKARAAVAVARTILQSVYYMLSRGTGYSDLGEQHFQVRDKERALRRHVRQLQLLGYEVQVTARPQEAA